MSTLSTARGGVRRGFLHLPNFEGGVRRALKKVYSAAESSAIFAGVLVSTVAMFVPLTLLQPSFTHKAPKTAPAASSAASPAPAQANNKSTAPVKPNVVQGTAAAGTAACSPALSNADQSFGACPSFMVDYSGMNHGTVDRNHFNVYTGKPVANNEAEYYTANPENLRIENGSLMLEARTSTQQGVPYTSAKIDTQGKEDFLYGKLVVRAKMPAGVGTWPAIWMLPSQPKYASLSPGVPNNYLNDGELDIAEAVGWQPNRVYSVAHSVLYDNNGVDHTYFNTITVPGNDTSFHDYEMDWTPTKLTFKVDGRIFYTYRKPANATYKSWPYDQPFYLILNLALGGSWAGQDRKDFPKDGINPAALPTALHIQSLRYYSYNGNN